MTIRQRGLWLFLGGTAAFFVLAYLLAHPDKFHFILSGNDGPMAGMALIAIGIPGAAAMAGLVELVTGKPIRELEAVWAGFEWWQKLILGLLFVFVGVAFVVPIVFFTLT